MFMAYIIHRKDRPKPWRVYWRNERSTLCSKSFAGRQDARAHARFVEAHADAAVVHSTTLRIAADQWLADSRARLSPHTIVSYVSVMGLICDAMGRTARVDRIASPDITRWRNEMASRLRPSTVRNYIKDVRVFFNWAVQQGYCAKNPATSVAVPNVRRGIPRWLDETETVRLLEDALRTDAATYLVVLLGIRAGLRRREIRMLRWSDIRNDTIQVRETKSKNPRIVPLHPDIKNALADWPKRGDFLFPPKRHGSANDLYRGTAQGKAVNAWLATNGYDATMHSLRHSFASQLAAAGASEAEIRDLLGHTSIDMTRLYTHARDTLKRQHVLSLGAVTPVS
jgi:integrase